MLRTNNKNLVCDENDIFSTFVLSEIGDREEQQDSYGLEFKSDEGIVVVCDGMGGHAQGKKASNKAVDFVLKRYLQSYSIKSPYKWLIDVANDSDKIISSLANADSNSMKSGTTITAVYIHEKEMYWLSVGDSRLYLFRDSRLIRMTLDHTYKTLLEKKLSARQIDNKVYDEEVKYGDRLVSFLGINGIPYLEANSSPFEIKAGDRIVLTTDGLYKIVSDNILEQILDNFNDPYDAINSISQKAKQCGENTVKDNITVALISIK